MPCLVLVPMMLDKRVSMQFWKLQIFISMIWLFHNEVPRVKMEIYSIFTALNFAVKDDKISPHDSQELALH